MLKSKLQGAIQRRRGSPNISCPLCTGTDFSLQPGYAMVAVQEELNMHVLGGKVMPTALLICTNCGFVAQLALGTLDPAMMERHMKSKEEG